MMGTGKFSKHDDVLLGMGNLFQLGQGIIGSC
jgi:hypothetical protein